MSAVRGTVPPMSRPTDADWSMYRSAMVQIRPNAWVATLPMTCPRCCSPWSDDGLVPIRGQVHSHRAAPPGGQVATTCYECAACGHQAYDER